MSKKRTSKKSNGYRRAAPVAKPPVEAAGGGEVEPSQGLVNAAFRAWAKRRAERQALEAEVIRAKRAESDAAQAIHELVKKPRKWGVGDGRVIFGPFARRPAPDAELVYQFRDLSDDDVKELWGIKI